jgi:hypothetical protein
LSISETLNCPVYGNAPAQLFGVDVHLCVQTAEG